ncbi:PKD domain-containing protein [Ekhidna sp.]|uniref:right-handed parallel beta-helix repeat-containing protein n=1 Tax=Ekhidna sp. TaxID=2608089 RepID=UPI003C7ABE80
MKTFIYYSKNILTKLFLILTLFLLSCSDDGSDPGPSNRLEAIVTNSDQTVSPLSEVTLDGSQSTGPEGFRYEWIYNGSENINLSSTSEAIVTFTPDKTGFYSFTLRTTYGGQFSETHAQVTVSGAIVLDDTFFTGSEEVVELKDLGDEEFDYIINEDLTIPDGKTLQVNAGSSAVTVAINENAGIIIKGSFKVESSSFIQLSTSDQKWKGILIDGGELQNANGTMYIYHAGNAPHDGQTEAAAITAMNGGILSGDIQVLGYGSDLELGVLYHETADNTSQSGYVFINGYRVAAKLPISLLKRVNNFSLQNYEYIEVETAGAGVTEALSPDEDFQFQNWVFYINDGFTAGSKVLLHNATIYFPEDKGLVSSASLTINNATLKGLNDSNWKGVAATQNVTIRNSTIVGAGSSVHNTGSFSSVEPAAIYLGSLENIEISGSIVSESQGYGVFCPNNMVGTIRNCTFDDNELYDISLGINSPVSTVIGVGGHSWGSNLPVELRGGNILNHNVVIPDLGEDASYLISDNINAVSGQIEVKAGASLKFKMDKGLSVSTKLQLLGTAANPVILDGETGTSGSWKGIELLGTYRIEHSTITNGGSSAYIGADAANVVFGSGSDTQSHPHNGYRFDYNMVSSSTGKGTHVKLAKYNPLIDNPTNTFEGNVSQDSDGDGIPDNGEFPGCENDPGC